VGTELFHPQFRMDTGDVGIAYGTMLIVAGGSGTLFAALLARRWQNAGHRGSTARVALFATVASVPFTIAFPLSGSRWRWAACSSSRSAPA
jgi:hypothetical protein